MSQNDTGAGRLPERKDDRASGATRQGDEEHRYENAKGCLTLLAIIVVFFGVSVGLAMLTR